MGRELGSWGCLAWRKEGSLSMCIINVYKFLMVCSKDEARVSSVVPLTRQEPMGINWKNTKNSILTWENVIYCCEHPIFGDTQNLTGHSSGQPDIVETEHVRWSRPSLGSLPTSDSIVTEYVHIFLWSNLDEKFLSDLLRKAQTP